MTGAVVEVVETEFTDVALEANPFSIADGFSVMIPFIAFFARIFFRCQGQIKSCAIIPMKTATEVEIVNTSQVGKLSILRTVNRN